MSMSELLFASLFVIAFLGWIVFQYWDGRIRMLSAAVGMTLAFAACGEPAKACHRCGLFGNKCRFAYSYPTYQPVAYTPPNYVNNYVFNNSAPYPIATPQGNSVLGYSLQQQSYNINPALELDRSARLGEIMMQNAGRAYSLHNSAVTGALALQADADRHARNTMMVMAAIQPQVVQPQSFSFRVTTNSRGEMKVENIEQQLEQPMKGVPTQAPPTQAPQGGTLTPIQGTVTLELCARCHDGNGTNNTPQGSVIGPGVELSRQQYLKAAGKIMGGTMPPPDYLRAQYGMTSLPVDQRVNLVDQLQQLVR